MISYHKLKAAYEARRSTYGCSGQTPTSAELYQQNHRDSETFDLEAQRAPKPTKTWFGALPAISRKALIFTVGALTIFRSYKFTQGSSNQTCMTARRRMAAEILEFNHFGEDGFSLVDLDITTEGIRLNVDNVIEYDNILAIEVVGDDRIHIVEKSALCMKENATSRFGALCKAVNKLANSVNSETWKFKLVAVKDLKGRVFPNKLHHVTKWVAKANRVKNAFDDFKALKMNRIVYKNKSHKNLAGCNGLISDIHVTSDGDLSIVLKPDCGKERDCQGNAVITEGVFNSFKQVSGEDYIKIRKQEAGAKSWKSGNVYLQTGGNSEALVDFLATHLNLLEHGN